MLHTAFSEDSFKPRFSGHETFSLRYNWLSKILAPNVDNERYVWISESSLEQAMVRYGVGKNMVHSMSHWACLSDVAELHPEAFLFKPTEFGQRFIWERDPHLEELGTIWALHWKVCTRPHLATTWYWMFNGFPKSLFDTRSAVDSIQAIASTHGWRIPSLNTIERDIDCFLRCYTVARAKKGALSEDSLECPFAELELIQPTNDRGIYEFQRGPKPTLPDKVFTFALAEFWKSTGVETLSLEHVAHAPGSPGRVFKLDDQSVAERMLRIEDLTDGALRWIDNSGLRQLQRSKRINDTLEILIGKKNKKAVK